MNPTMQRLIAKQLQERSAATVRAEALPLSSLNRLLLLAKVLGR